MRGPHCRGVDQGMPSETARRVAAQRLTFPRIEVDYGDPGADERLAADVASGGDVAESPLRRYLEARTRFFDSVVVESIASGISQIVVGAAGYDGRAWRYSRPGVDWFELDHPDTQRDKLRRLAALGIDSSAVGFAAADFAVGPIGPPLKAAGLDDVRPTLMLLEGVAVYLPRPILESVLRQLRALASAGSRLAASFSVSGDSPGAVERRNAFAAAVAGMGEPARTTIEPHQVSGLLDATGWRTTPHAGERSGPMEQYLRVGFVIAEPG